MAVAESDLNIDGAQLIPPFETITPYSLVAVMQSTFKGGVGISSAAGSSGSSFLPFLETLKNVDKLADSGERGLKIQAKVLCARGLLETGQLDASMELIKDVSLNLTQAVTDMGQYGRVVAVMAAVIKCKQKPNVDLHF